MFDADPSQPRWIVVDFSAVTGIDSSAAHTFLRLLRNSDPLRVHVRFCGMSDHVLDMWNRMLENGGHVPLFSQIDEALEWCENDLLGNYDSYSYDFAAFELWLREQFGAEYETLLEHVRRIELAIGDALCMAGEPSDAMFIIETGRVAVLVGDEAATRVRSLGAHTFVGESGFYRRRTRNATIVAESPTIVHELSRDTLDQIEISNPRLARVIHTAVVRTLAERLEYQTAVSLEAMVARN